MEQKEPVHETLPDECAQTFLLPDTIRTLFWTGCGLSILSSAQMTAEDLAFAVWDLSEAYAAYMQKLIEQCGICDALCECRAAKQEEIDALRRLPLALLAAGAAGNIAKAGRLHSKFGESACQRRCSV